ncbi:MAG: DNA polymerase III subunit alpha [Gemmatales bacterium]|nr:DNA polymerase III subunit alpha [Gemmatales bacterium]MDW8221366.1 DNA polymerase III subunit alpha [Gemmatales bacterium]
MARPFVHLHCHSHYSLLDGASRIPELVSHVKSLGMNALALTDHGNLYGAIEFYQHCVAQGIKPIIGYEAYVAPGSRFERDSRGTGEAAYHLTLLAYNEQGFRNLIRLASLAFLEGFYYRPRIDKELLERCNQGLICLSGCASSEFSTLILQNRFEEATELARWLARTFSPDRFYIEIQNNGLEIQRRCLEGAVEIARRLNLPLVATADAHYLTQEDAEAHDILLCINTGKQRQDVHRLRYGSNLFYVRSPQEMYDAFPGYEEAVAASQGIAERCSLHLDFTKRHYPVFCPPGGLTPEQYLRQLCEEGLRQRYGNPPPPRARERLEHELEIICRLGFAGYFLIVHDFVRFARSQGIPYGARGSACGALVSYVLQLSHIDPLEYGLLFERFLDPKRAEAPDIDIDFCQLRREEVLDYVRQRYGADSVAQIGTFGTLAARAAVRDVGRALGLPRSRVEQITRLIPRTPGVTLAEALETIYDLRQEYETDPQVRECLDIALKLEGTNRTVSTHAAGVVIANGPLVDYVPVQRVWPQRTEGGEESNAVEEPEHPRTAGRDGIVITQWTMEDLEKVGMLKMDFLGLRTLTLLDHAVQLIKENHGRDLDLHRLPLNDEKTYAMLQRGDAVGVFQFEGEGIRHLLQRLKPDNIRDLIACNALYRPGPLGGGMVDAYVNRKHGREKPVYQHPVMEEVLAETYGIMVYQEQVMLILNRLGGVDLSNAYACIKAISKKKQETIAQRRQEFIEGAVARGVRRETAEEIFDQIVHFGGYGFNKSHAAAYALVAYQTAYLKAHFPTEFMAALLTSEIGKSEKLAQYVAHARQIGVRVLPPDINRSQVEFRVEQGQIRYALAALRGVGYSAAQALVAERNQRGPYKDLYDLCCRLDPRVVSRSTLETLINAGALDEFGRRAALLEALGDALSSGARFQEDRKAGQRSFLDSLEPASEVVKRALPNVEDWSYEERSRREKEAFGFYFALHPLASWGERLASLTTMSIRQLLSFAANAELPPDLLLGGMITEVRLSHARKSRSGNTKMARFKLQDLEDSLECLIFPDEFAACQELVAEESVVLVRGTLDRTRDTPVFIVTRVLSYPQALRELTRAVLLRMTLRHHRPCVIEEIRDILQRNPGQCPVFLEIRDRKDKRALLILDKTYHVDVAHLDCAALESVLGKNSVYFQRANGLTAGHAVETKT